MASVAATALTLRAKFGCGLEFVLLAGKEVEMSANRFPSLCFLLFAVMLGEACSAGGASNNRDMASPNISLDAGDNAPGNRGGVSPKDYSDPDNTFAIKMPSGWIVEREEKDGAYLTVIRPAQYRAANLSIMTIKGAPTKTDAAELKSHMLVESSKPIFQGWINALKEQARVEGTGRIYPTQFNKLDALRMDVTYYREDGDDPRQGYGIFLVGDKTAFFISLTGSQSRFKELEEIISTLRIEP
jgi:hypothetical protein